MLLEIWPVTRQSRVRALTTVNGTQIKLSSKEEFVFAGRVALSFKLIVVLFTVQSLILFSFLLKYS